MYSAWSAVIIPGAAAWPGPRARPDRFDRRFLSDEPWMPNQIAAPIRRFRLGPVPRSFGTLTSHSSAVGELLRWANFASAKSIAELTEKKAFNMKAYIVSTGVIFGLLVLAHILRVVDEGLGPAKNPWFILTTVVALFFSA